MSKIRGDQRGGLQTNWKNIKKNRIPLKVLLQLFLKYVYKLDILIHQFYRIEFSDDILQIFQNF